MYICRLFQVNWLTKTGFIYDRNNLSKVCLLLSMSFPFSIPGSLELDRYCNSRCSLLVSIFEYCHLLQVKIFNNQMKDGWGLATDGQVLFGSDGTSTLYQIDPRTMKGFHLLGCYGINCQLSLPVLLRLLSILDRIYGPFNCCYLLVLCYLVNYCVDLFICHNQLSMFPFKSSPLEFSSCFVWKLCL